MGTPLDMLPFHETALDREWLFQLYQRTLQPYIDDAFGWNDRRQRRRFDARCPDSLIRILLVGFEVAGYVVVRSRPGCKHVALLVLDPDYQGRGIGRRVMERIHADALQSRARVCLSSFKDNTRAVGFYQALGYRQTAEDADFVEL